MMDCNSDVLKMVDWENGAQLALRHFASFHRRSEVVVQDSGDEVLRFQNVQRDVHKYTISRIRECKYCTKQSIAIVCTRGRFHLWSVLCTYTLHFRDAQKVRHRHTTACASPFLW